MRQKYPKIINEIVTGLEILFPDNKVSVCKHSSENCVDVSVYPNKLNEILPWRVGRGTKIEQQTHVPAWIFTETDFIESCLRGLFQTDGSIYTDRKYLMVNFTNLIQPLINDVFTMITALGFNPNVYNSTQNNGNIKYVVRLSRDVEKFINQIKLTKE